MRSFGLTPEQVIARDPDAGGKLPPSWSFSVVYGALSVGVVSVLAYSLWAYGVIRGTAPLYSSVAAVYVLGTGLALSRLVIGSGSWLRFALLFAVAFVIYALVWSAVWFGLHGKHHADLWGFVVGLLGIAVLLRSAFGYPGSLLALYGVLFTFHMCGYYLGDAFHAGIRGPTGRLLWGAAHGIGFGAGLGHVLFCCQTSLTTRSRPVTA